MKGKTEFIPIHIIQRLESFNHFEPLTRMCKVKIFQQKHVFPTSENHKVVVLLRLFGFFVSAKRWTTIILTPDKMVHSS